NTESRGVFRPEPERRGRSRLAGRLAHTPTGAIISGAPDSSKPKPGWVLGSRASGGDGTSPSPRHSQGPDGAQLRHAPDHRRPVPFHRRRPGVPAAVRKSYSPGAVGG